MIIEGDKGGLEAAAAASAAAQAGGDDDSDVTREMNEGEEGNLQGVSVKVEIGTADQTGPVTSLPADSARVPVAPTTWNQWSSAAGNMNRRLPNSSRAPSGGEAPGGRGAPPGSDPDLAAPMGQPTAGAVKGRGKDRGEKRGRQEEEEQQGLPQQQGWSLECVFSRRPPVRFLHLHSLEPATPALVCPWSAY